jgi:hypothetical protein
MFQGNRENIDNTGSNPRQPITRRTVLGGSLAAGLGIFGGD